MKDTSPLVQQRVIELFHSLSIQQKFEHSASLTAAGKYYAERAILRRQPELKGIELQIAVFRWLYQDELSKEFFDGFEKEFRDRFSKS